MHKIIPILALALAFVASTANAEIPSSITIQGRLTDASGLSVSPGLRIFTFRIFDAESGGTELWPGGMGEVQVIYTDSSGLWGAGLGDSIPLAPTVFAGASHWLEITVDDGGNPPETLSRIRLRSQAYSFRSAKSDVALNADSLGGLSPSSFAPSGHSHVITSVDILDGSIGFADVGQNGADTGDVMKWNGWAWEAAHDSTGEGANGGGWVDDGSAVRLSSGSDFVGIGTMTPAAALHVNSPFPQFQAEVTPTDKWVFGGGTVTFNIARATDGIPDYAKGIAITNTGNVGMGTTDPAAKLDVVGDIIINGKAALGPGNDNSGVNAFVAGENDTASGAHSVVSGGKGNVASGLESTVGGGTGNKASGTGAAVIGGSHDTASGGMATVAGGQYNRAAGLTSFAAGFRAKADHAGTFVWADTTDADLASTSDNQFLIRASGGVGIGTDSPTAALHVHGAIRSDSGGIYFPDGTLQTTASVAPDSLWVLSDSVLYTGGYWGIVRGGAGNSVNTTYQHTIVNLGSAGHADAPFGTVGGGYGNQVNDAAGTIAGGQDNTIWSGNGASIGGGTGHFVQAQHGTIGGGYRNHVGTENTSGARGKPSALVGIASGTIAGGKYNIVYHGSCVGGGESNSCSSPYSTIAGGFGNWTGEEFPVFPGYQTVGGGLSNHTSGSYGTVAGGESNLVDNSYGTIAGGVHNTASGAYATIPGGRLNNAAGGYSLAAGRRAKADSAGTFVWADSSDFDFHCDTVNEFAARATGGVRFVSAIDSSGNPTAGVKLAAGSGSWASLSDSTAKEHIKPVDGRVLLETVARLAVSEWNYKSQPESIRHIGPMAQDFRALFGVGEDERYISQVDIAGVALAAIKELHRQNADLQKRVEQMEAKLAGN